MNKKSCLPFIYSILLALFIVVLVPSAHAYQRYNDGCQNCHGAFTSTKSTKGSSFGNGKHKLEMHRGSDGMGTDCDLCHAQGDHKNPYMGSSRGTSHNPGLGCVGCHGREEDAGNDGLSPGRGAGLRQHHFNRNRIENTPIGPLSSQICADCHSDADPGNYTPVGEHVKPPYYATADTNVKNPCNPIGQSNLNENWTIGDLNGLDSDGDLLYDLNDPDCQDVETACFNGLDDDHDGLPDCADPDCEGAIDTTPTACGTGECASTGQTICVGGVEEDTCTPGTPGIEGPAGDPTCGDMMDNDCDGMTDAGDSNCDSGGSGGTKTLHTMPSSGVNIANGIQTDHGSCSDDPTSPYVEELSTVRNDMCASSYRYRQYATGLHSEHYFNTAYPSDTTVTGVSYQFTLHDGGTFGIQLFYVMPDGSKTYLGAEVTQSNPHDLDNNYTMSLSGQSGTVPAGAKLGLRTRLVSLSDSYATVYLGDPDGRTGNISGKLIVEESAGASPCPDNDNDGYVACDGVCDPGALLCGDCNDGASLVNPSEPDICDGIDNNCDGTIDENLTRSTSCGVGECAGNTGVETCTAGTWGGDTCDPLAGATPEICDDAGMLDEDCDGLANVNDPECGCVPTGPEICDNLDNNCDGAVDEDFTNLGMSCTVGLGACEATGSYICTGDGLGTECDATPGTPGTEGPEGDPTCSDTIDNDCNGMTDGNDVACGGAVTPPPARQKIGVQDGLYNNLVQADCRFCHQDDAAVPVEGRCSVTGTVCFEDAGCPVGEVCEPTRIQDRHHILAEVPEPIPGGSLIFANPGSPTDPDANNDGVNDAFYACESCHPDDPGVPGNDFTVTRDCLQCHVQLPGSASVHHLTATAQGTDSPIGDPNVGDCTPCHGTLVDDAGDGHVIPTYAPTPETPARSGGNGLPFNSRGVGAGGCDYCHDNGISPEGILVETNMDTHHNTGLGPPVEDPSTSEKCAWCHDFSLPFEAQIRVCENCHGMDSLHNIQADSDGDGVINPGIEQPFYGHIGDPDDCWGCHGFGPTSAAPESGPVVPTISSVSEPVLTEGTDTTITVSGSAFTNMDQGTELISDVTLTAEDGTSTLLIPNTISEGLIEVTIPGTLSSGNYKLKAKKQDKYSNPKVITIEPGVTISNVTCRGNKRRGYTLTITGTGFGDAPPEGSGAYLNIVFNGVVLESTTTWTDTEITAAMSRCPSTSIVNVNAVFGSDTVQTTTGKISKPKK